MIYPSLPEYSPLLNIYVTLPESTPPSLNIHFPPFKHLYATLPESTHPRIDTAFFDIYMRHSHNLPLPLRIYPALYKVTLPESTSPFQNIPAPFYNYMRRSQNLSRPPKICPAFPKYRPTPSP